MLLQLEPKNGQPANEERAQLDFKNKYQNPSRQYRRTLLRRLDNSAMRVDIDHDVLLFEMYQLRNELRDLGQAVSTEGLIMIILDVLPAEKYSAIKI